MIGQLEITVTKTADGKHKYVQIASPAAMPVNIVLICDEVVVHHLDAVPGKALGGKIAGPPPLRRRR